VILTGVSWLTEGVRQPGIITGVFGDVTDLRLDGAYLGLAHLEGANLVVAYGGYDTHCHLYRSLLAESQHFPGLDRQPSVRRTGSLSRGFAGRDATPQLAPRLQLCCATCPVVATQFAYAPHYKTVRNERSQLVIMT
jgi:hypothetical protein